jgi:23S rRNA pseudouridine1911/1915/1917 synthase
MTRPELKRGKAGKDTVGFVEPDHSGALEKRTYLVTPAYHGRRLDVFLRDRLPWRSRTAIKTLILGGRVRVDGATSKPGRKVLEGDVVEVVPEAPSVDEIRHDEIPLSFLYEDEHVFVLDKQAGLIVHPVAHQLYNTLINALHYHYRARLGQLDVSPKLAHRLDRDTSGVLLVSKNKRMRKILQDAFEGKRVGKEYRAIVHGVIPDDTGRIDAPLLLRTREDGRRMMIVDGDGAVSMTRFEVLERFEAHTYVRLTPVTGRTHQLRVHMSHRGHPILCDRLYGRESRVADSPPGSDGNAPRVLIERQALHSGRLVFPHPATGEILDIRSPLPPDMEEVLRHLRRGGRLFPADAAPSADEEEGGSEHE